MRDAQVQGARRSERRVTDNESLEFLADAVLGLVVSEALSARFPPIRREEVEDQSNLVSTACLAERRIIWASLIT